MKKLTYFWKMLHFCIYSLIRTIQMAANKCFYSLVPSRLTKYLWARKGVYGTDAIKEQMNYETANAKWSPVVLQAGIHMGGILVVLQVALAQFIAGSFGEEAVSSYFANIYVYGFFFLVIAGVINYSLLFKNDKYLNDFAEFEKLPNSVLLKYKILSFLFICAVIGLFIGSLVWGVGG